MSKSERGFETRELKDYYGRPFGLSESSLDGADCVWLSPESAVMTMARDAEAVQRYLNGLRLDGGDGTGWIDIPLQDKVSIHSAILLDREMAKTLSDELAYFAEHGHMRELDC